MERKIAELFVLLCFLCFYFILKESFLYAYTCIHIDTLMHTYFILIYMSDDTEVSSLVEKEL